MADNKDVPKKIGWVAYEKIGHPIYYRDDDGHMVPEVKEIKVGDTVYVYVLAGFFEAIIEKEQDRYRAVSKTGNYMALLEFDKDDNVWYATCVANVRALKNIKFDDK